VTETSEQPIRSKVRRVLGPVWTTRLLCLLRGRGLPRWGNLRRLKPFSECHGWDRGTPLDRYYVDRFFERHRALITGDVLEIDRNIYTHRYGHDLRTVHSVDIDPHSEPTFLCDLAHSENVVPSEAYDCVLLPCTLHHFRELKECLRNVLRVVKPGGTILATGAGMVRLDAVGNDFWHPTPDGWRELLGQTWPGCKVVVEGEGNCLAAMAFNLGLALEELKHKELDHNDGLFPVITTIYCHKPEDPGGKSEAE
jgi:SAM-dependent methyltransferase